MTAARITNVTPAMVFWLGLIGLVISFIIYCAGFDFHSVVGASVFSVLIFTSQLMDHHSISQHLDNDEYRRLNR